MRRRLPEPFHAAFLRGLYAALILGGISILTSKAVTGSWEEALIIGGATALTALGARTGVEGAIDHHRAGAATSIGEEAGP